MGLYGNVQFPAVLFLRLLALGVRRGAPKRDSHVRGAPICDQGGGIVQHRVHLILWNVLHYVGTHQKIVGPQLERVDLPQGILVVVRPSSGYGVLDGRVEIVAPNEVT